MIDLLLSNFSRYTILKDSRENWSYIQRLCCGLILFFILLAVDKNRSGTGLDFFQTSSVLFSIALTFAAIFCFSSAITEDKENGTLGLILVSGSPRLTYLGGRFLGRAFHMASLLSLLVPIALFAITLGGVALFQVLQAFVIISLWIGIVSLICFWTSVLFATNKESFIIAGLTIAILLISMIFFKFSLFHRLNEIMSIAGYQGYFIEEIILFCILAIILLKSIKENFEFAAVSPITFLDDYLSKIRRRKLEVQTHSALVYNRVRVGIKPIADKDRVLIPLPLTIFEYAKKHPASTIVLCMIGFGLFPLLFITLILYIPYKAFRLWDRIIKVFELELEEGTLSTLTLLPYSKEELLKEKLSFVRPSVTLLAIFNLLIVLMLIPVTIFSWTPLIAALGVPLLMYFLKYLNLIIIFNSRKVDKLNCFIITLLIIVTYCLIPVFSAVALVGALPFMKKLCLRKFDECISAL